MYVLSMKGFSRVVYVLDSAGVDVAYLDSEESDIF